MKNKFLLSILVLACLLAGLVDGCKKDSMDKPGIATSFTEEFQEVNKLETTGWVIKDNSAATTRWLQAETGKGGGTFPAYSYTASPNECTIAYASLSVGTYYEVSSWLITPVLAIENGDKISFYSRTDTVFGNVYQDRMQVRMSTSTSADVGDNPGSVGGFTTVLLDINSTQAAGGYPGAWTKYEYTFSGISGKVDRRIGFRYFVTNTAIPLAVGIDLFKFDK